MTERSCGPCFACCQWLGINELRKYTGQLCKHLTGANGPEHRCSIYPTRPTVCADYHCMWLDGFAEDNDRPNNSGLLLTPYPAKLGGEYAVTIIVIDEAKAGTLEKGNLARMVGTLLRLGCNEIIVNNFLKKTAHFFANGKIYLGRLERGQSYEDCIFKGDDKPIASYNVFENMDEAADWSSKNPVRDGQHRILG